MHVGVHARVLIYVHMCLYGCICVMHACVHVCVNGSAKHDCVHA